jgi:hypothetical protein
MQPVFLVLLPTYSTQRPKEVTMDTLIALMLFIGMTLILFFLWRIDQALDNNNQTLVRLQDRLDSLLTHPRSSSSPGQ